MDGFTYTNIFDTKGLEYLAIIAFFIILVPFWILLNRQVKLTKQIQKTLGILTSSMLRIPQGLFFSRNHTWAHLEKSGLASVGVDDLLMHVAGEVSFSYLKSRGESIQKGEKMAEIENGGKHLTIFSPVSGEILDTNQLLNEYPEMLNRDPYGKGWVYQIKPSNWMVETRSYFLADEATQWSRQELARFKDFLASTVEKYSPDPSRIVLQDGGELKDHSLSELPAEMWLDFQQNFLAKPG